MTQNPVGVTTRKRVIAETMEALSEYNLPVIQDFIREENERRGLRIPVGGLRPNVIANIENNIDKKEGFPAEDLLDYVDRLRENGNQHIFLYQINQNHREYLRELRKPEYIRQRLEENGLLDRYNKSLHIWEARTPQLSAMTRRREPEDVLLFKWVETRTEQVTQKVEEDKQGNKIIIIKRVKRRAVCYFRIKLSNGDGELCVHQLATNARKAILDEREKYSAHIQKLIRLDYFHLVALEPAVHNLVIAPPAGGEVTDWKILLPEDATLGGGGNPDLSQWLGMLWKNFAGDHLKMDWSLGDRITKIKLDAETNELKLREALPPEQASRVIHAIRDYSKEGIKHPSLNKLAEEDDAYRTVLKKFDTLVTLLQKNNIDCKELIDNGEVSFDAVSDILEKLNSQFPEIFKNKYQVICPDTHRPIKKDGSNYLEYSSVTKIPPRVNCKEGFHKGRKTYHPTKGNIKPILSYAEPPKTPVGDGVIEWADQPKGLIDRIENALGKAIGRKIIKAMFLLVFASLYAGLTWAIVRSFLPLIQQYQGEKIFVAVPYFIILLLLVVLLVALFGVRTIERSITFLKLIIKAMIRTVFPGKRKTEAQSAPATKSRKVPHGQPKAESQDTLSDTAAQ